jgi:hypothetical protein
MLDIDEKGPVYLGRLDGPRSPLQGVRCVLNASRYTERGARQLAAPYRRAVAVPR